MAVPFSPFEPKVSFRYALLIDGITAFTCKAAGMPDLDQGEIVIDYKNVEFKVKGKSRWQNIDVTLYDPVEPSAAREVHTWIEEHHNSETGIDGYAFQQYKKDISIQALDPALVPVETWDIYGAYVQNSNWGDMDWSSEEAKELSLTINYDYAVLR